MKTTKYISINQEGIGNRLKCWVNALAMDPNALLYWPSNDLASCRFQELFVDTGHLVDEIPYGYEKIWRWRLTAFPRHLIPDNFSSYHGHDVTDGRAIDFEYNRIPEEVKGIFLPHFLALKPINIVKQEIDLNAKSF